MSRAELPTRHGTFELVAFASGDRELHDVALLKGQPQTAARVPVRVHSECLTGDVLGSLRCDCGQQLDLALHRLSASDHGALLYLRQEGRGIGIANKVRAYALQDTGLDTVEANEHLGFDDDLRTYDIAAGMLYALQIHAVTLHTNNPRKIVGLQAAGIDVMRQSIQVQAGHHNHRYLETKRTRSGHLLEPS